MRSVFDEHGVERQKRDTELTLGSGTLLAIFFGLVLLCGLCFGMGYAVGHRNAGPSAITTPQPAPDQEPLQASGAIPKPSAIAQVPVAAPPPATSPTPDATTAAGTTPAAPDPSAPVGMPAPAASPQENTPAQPLVHPALPVSTPASAQSANAPAVRPAMVQQFMVQVAAVSNPDDASVLMSALQKRNYPVSVRRDPGDNLLHVRIGPFASRAIADQWRAKLMSDGYNAIVQ